jgi:hypothetical protein
LSLQVWDLRTQECLQSLHDAHVHRPIDRLTAVCADLARGCVLTFGNHARLWRISDLALAAPRLVATGADGDATKHKAGTSSATSQPPARGKTLEAESGMEQLEESGWAVVDVDNVVDELEEQYADHKARPLPSTKVFATVAFEYLFLLSCWFALQQTKA